ncbi:monocarboxylate transporter 13-like [Glandiceps talaboti]
MPNQRDVNRSNTTRKKVSFVRSVSTNLPRGPPEWWKWVIVLCNFTVLLFCVGLNYGMWLIVDDLRGFFQQYELIQENVDVKWMLYINIVMVYVTGAFASWLAYRVGHRATAVSGAVLSTIGLFVSGFTKSVGFICFSYGILTGVGHGMLLTPSLGVLPRYFRRKYTFANSLTFVGTSIGMFFFPSLFNAVKAAYGRRAVFFIVASLNAQLIWLVLLYKPFQKTIPANKGASTAVQTVEDDEESQGSTSFLVTVRGLFRDLCCKRPLFVIMLLVMFLIGIGHNILILHLISVVKEAGSTASQFKWLVVACGICMMLGQLGHGIPSLFQVLRGGREATYELFMFGFSLTGVAVVAFLSSLASTFAGHLALVSMIGIASGIYFPLMIVLTEYSIHHSRPLTTALGLGLVMFGMGALIGLSVGDILNDVLKYNSSYFLAGATLMLSAVMMTYIVVHLFCRDKRRRDASWSNSIRRDSRPLYGLKRRASAPAKIYTRRSSL